MGQVLLKALISLGTKLLASFATEKLLEWALFKVADAIVQNTENTYDDEFVEKLKEVWDEQGKRGETK